MSRYSIISLVLVLILLFSGSFAIDPVSAQPQVTIAVTTTADAINEDGLCSLREAILAANTDTQVDACPAGSGADNILLTEGKFELSRSGQFEDYGLTGDLDIYSNIKIYGSGVNNTLLDAKGIDRVFHITGAYTVSMYNLTIQGGNAPGDMTQSRGGGILNQNGIVWLSRIMVIGNQSLNTGGGIDNFGGILNILDTTIANNQATRGGGVFSDNILWILRTLITGNVAADTGGGIDNNDEAGLFDVTISANIAAQDPLGQGGGGIFSDGNMELFNVTLVNNTGLGGFMNQGLARVSNSIFAQNGDLNCTGVNTFTSEGNNLDDDASCNFNKTGDILVEDALLESLSDNGGTTWTHALLLASPAVDAGNDSSCRSTDQRGAARPADGDEDGVAICDIGAFEYNATFNNLYLPVILH